jgi:hypothetical protein
MAAQRIHIVRSAHQSLAGLRNKTDRQLVALAAREIDRSLTLARRGAIAEAEAMQLEAATLLRVSGAPEWKRREIETRLERARAALERIRSAPMLFKQAAGC